MDFMGSCHSNDELVDRLQATGVFDSNRTRDIMRSVDRGDFTSTDPYADRPQSIGYEATISAPNVHALAIEALLDIIKPNSHVLDVGCGTGYLTTCFAKMVGPEGKVIGIEHIQELAEKSVKCVSKNNMNLLETGRIQFFTGDGRQGFLQEAPYDAIHVGAAAEGVPQALIDQLAPGGRLLIPIGKLGQEFMAIDKCKDGQIKKQSLAPVMYIPLCSKEMQLKGENRRRIIY